MYLKGVIYKLLDEYDHAKQCFEFVVNNESRIGREFSLPPQSMLELGLIEVILNNKDKAIELINKCINDYSGYTNDVYVHIRAFAGLRSLGVTTDKQNENDNKLEDYKKQWLRNLSLKEKKYNKVIEEEDTVDKHNAIHK
ncbi:uncharacterized protein LOC128953772 [Oppia nitens]|uniref:uncharacterized protein LOC128953772 n=1 Tax=Oppia nitens TaxID=1686743 RepID=UPI0023DBB5BE|nr:uncharacterized protein LOC128953772 [Oppia nitens]